MNSSIASVLITEYQPSPLAAPFTIATISGEIDLSNAEQIGLQLNDASQQHANLIIDLSAIIYIDSQGARMLQHLASRHTHGVLRLNIIAPRNSIARKLLSITAIDQTVPVIESLDAATREESPE